MVIDTATFDHANSQGIDVSWRHHLKRRSGTFGRTGGRLAHNTESPAERWTTSGHARHRGRLSYPGDGLDPFEHLPVIRSDLLGPVQTLIWHRQAKRKDLFRLNAEVHPG